MSAVSNTHKINGNSIVSANTANVFTTNSAVGAATIQKNTFPSNSHHSNQQHQHNHHHHQQQQQHQHPSGNLQQNQQQSAKLTNLTKLQAPQQHQQQQRRSLIPSTALQQQQQQQQQQSITVPTSAVTPTGATLPQANQLQTIATIHQPSSSQQPSQQQQQQHSAVNSTQASSRGITENPITRRSFYQLQSLKAHNNLKAPAHSIPPRYQPPPQPQPQPQSKSHSSSSILKNLNSQRLNSGSKTAYSSYSTGNHHLNNLKYPPDIPQLSSVFIPDSLKNPTNTTRYLQQRQGANPHQIQLQQSQQQQQHLDMLKFVRKTDQDHPSPNASSVTSSGTGGGIPPSNTGGRLTAEQNRQLQSLINELQVLKEQNQRLMDDNQELRDLCCFLDDDRQKGRKLAREWQRFGRYTASVMRQEVAAYQNKLRQLDDKQHELINDNLELKELCLYLDEERAHIAANSLCVNCGATMRNFSRDDGDGSSSSINADENLIALRNYEQQLPDLHLRTNVQDETLQYVRSLERRIQQLEEERINNNTNNATTTSAAPLTNVTSQHHHPQQQQTHQQHHQTSRTQASSITATLNQKLAQQTSAMNDNLTDPISGRPEAVVRALQVLEVREQLERDRLGNITGQAIEQMDDGEKALVREMCNVVWRKLEGNPNGPTDLD